MATVQSDRGWGMKLRRRIGAALTVFSGLSVIGCATYCMLCWPKPAVPTLLIVDVALTCWLYCGTLWPVWGGVALLSGGLLVLVGAGLWLGRAWAIRLAPILGLLTLPIGVLPLYVSLSASSRGRRLEK
jgi:hypothetical protein